jgi:hypothetical protein
MNNQMNNERALCDFAAAGILRLPNSKVNQKLPVSPLPWAGFLHQPDSFQGNALPCLLLFGID